MTNYAVYKADPRARCGRAAQRLQRGYTTSVDGSDDGGGVGRDSSSGREGAPWRRRCRHHRNLLLRCTVAISAAHPATLERWKNPGA